jgi:hypothetical protein
MGVCNTEWCPATVDEKMPSASGKIDANKRIGIKG